MRTPEYHPKFESESLLSTTGKFVAREAKVFAKSALVSGIEFAAAYTLLNHFMPGLLPPDPATLWGGLLGVEFVRQSSERPLDKDGL